MARTVRYIIEAPCTLFVRGRRLADAFARRGSKMREAVVEERRCRPGEIVEVRLEHAGDECDFVADSRGRRDPPAYRIWAQAEARPHPLRLSSPEHNGDLWLCTVQLHDARVYSCPWRREAQPTEAEILAAWWSDRRAFTEGDGR